jgi:hypothetical protein
MATASAADFVAAQNDEPLQRLDMYTKFTAICGKIAA